MGAMNGLCVVFVAALTATACLQSAPPSTCRTGSAVATHATHEFDAEDLRAAALPQSDLGSAYSGFRYDWFLGGFESNEERARDKSERPAEDRRDLERYARRVGYQEMYVSPDQGAAVVRIFTLVGLFRDRAGASAYLASIPVSGPNAVELDEPGLGDEARGSRVIAAGPRTEVRTRVHVRRGPLLGTVGVNRRDEADVNAEMRALADKLDERLRRVLSGDLRGYSGAPGTEIGAERLQMMAIPLSELGPAYSAYREDYFHNGFQDNFERSQTTISFDSTDEDREFEQCGRVTGYFEAFDYPAAHRTSRAL